MLANHENSDIKLTKNNRLLLKRWLMQTAR